MEQGKEQCGNKEAVKGIFCICFHFNLWFVSKCKEKNLKKNSAKISLGRWETRDPHKMFG